MARRNVIIASSLLGLLLLAAFVSTPPALVNATSIPELPTDIDAWLETSENEVDAEYSLIPGTEKRVVWREIGVRTEYAVVSLHGFSATRQETAPLAERVAELLDANLFETRLTGHGHSEQPMDGVSAEDWLEDAAEALAIGAELGDKIIVMGSSTGGTLALAMSLHKASASVTDIILLSPNLQPADGNSKWLTRPGGPILAKLVAGDTRTWTPYNELQGKFWSTSYPIEAVIEVMRLVDLVKSREPLTIDTNLLVLLSPEDSVVSADVTKSVFDRIETARKQLVEIEGVQDPSRHVIAGDILSPATTEEVADRIVGFVRD